MVARLAADVIAVAGFVRAGGLVGATLRPQDRAMRRLALPLSCVLGFIAGAAVAQETPQAKIERGRYLVTAADCAACHTAPGGAAMAGGGLLETDFGRIYGSNITPDPEHGIGRWSADDFYKAMHDGTSPGGHPLYPAMPYTSYRAMPREDVDAVYAYLMQLSPVRQASTPNELHFPYNLRFSLFFW